MRPIEVLMIIACALIALFLSWDLILVIYFHRKEDHLKRLHEKFVWLSDDSPKGGHDER